MNLYKPTEDIQLTLHIGIGCGEINTLHLGGTDNYWEFFPAGSVFGQLHDPGKLEGNKFAIIKSRNLLGLDHLI